MSNPLSTGEDGRHVPVISPSLSGPEIFRFVSEEGREELRRPMMSLWWSSVVAGFAISMSFYCKAYLHALLPDAPWRPAISSLGYSVGFVIIVFGRLQLFTENTISTVLPVLEDRTRKTLLRVARLWLIVLAGNLVGCSISAVLVMGVPLVADAPHAAMIEVAAHYAHRSDWQMFTHGVPAGFLVAAMVWSSPSSGSSRFWVVVMLSYMISAGDHTHVVAGSTELFGLIVEGSLGLMEAATATGATGIGNIFGGTIFFALLTYAQAHSEIDPQETIERAEALEAEEAEAEEAEEAAEQAEDGDTR